MAHSEDHRRLRECEAVERGSPCTWFTFMLRQILIVASTNWKDCSVAQSVLQTILQHSSKCFFPKYVYANSARCLSWTPPVDLGVSGEVVLW